MGTSMKRVGGTVAIVAVGVVAIVIIFKLLSSIVRIILSLVVLGVIVFAVLKLIQAVKRQLSEHESVIYKEKRMGTNLKRKTSLEKVGVVACLGGGILAWVFVHWILGVIVLGGGVYLFTRLMKHMAESGQRFQFRSHEKSEHLLSFIIFWSA